jgi:probable phosphomutase (TIGR03848 family)
VRFDLQFGWAIVTTFLLIRHALCDPVGHAIAGRSPGIHLNTEGRKQAEALAARFSGATVAALFSSPLERALETAGPLGRVLGLEVQVASGLNEIHFGEWTGKSLAELDSVPAWRDFNSFRSTTRIPDGETMAEVLARALVELERLRQAYPGSGTTVALISHGDVLRAMVAYSLGLSLDLLHRIEISPASVSILELESHGPRILLLNSTQGRILLQDAGLADESGCAP